METSLFFMVYHAPFQEGSPVTLRIHGYEPRMPLDRPSLHINKSSDSYGAPSRRNDDGGYELALRTYAGSLKNRLSTGMPYGENRERESPFKGDNIRVAI